MKGRQFSFETYSEILKQDGIKKHNRHLKEGLFVRGIKKPHSNDLKTKVSVELEIRRNPWYMYREFLCDNGKTLLYEQDYAVAHCIMNSINVWISREQELDMFYDSLLKSLVSMAFHKSSKRILILTRDDGRAKDIRERLDYSIQKIPEHLMYLGGKQYNLVINSAFNIESIIYHIKYFDIIVCLDLELQRNLNRFFEAFYYYWGTDKQFVFTDSEVNLNPDDGYNNKVHNQILLSKFMSGVVCDYWHDKLYDKNPKRLSNKKSGLIYKIRYAY